MRNRDTQLNIRLSQSEMDRLTRNARRSGLSKSNYIRMLVNGYVPKESPPIGYNQLIRAMTDVYSELKLQHSSEAARFTIASSGISRSRRLPLSATISPESGRV